MLWLTTVNLSFNKGTLKNVEIWGSGKGEEDDVEKVGRTFGKILTTHLLKAETKQQES